MSPRMWKRLRQTTQVLALLGFLAVFVYTNAQRPQRFWTDVFAQLDPLLMVSASLAGRVLHGGLILAALVVLLTMLFGRVWCGWMCPLGTLLEWLGPHRARRKAPPERLRVLKHLILIAILTAALMGNQTLIVLDPITLLNRTLATAVWPGLRHAVVGVEGLLYRVPALWGPLDAIHGAIVQPLFQDVQPVFSLGLLSALVFLALVGLNWLAERFWCSYLCPLGGLLGLLSKLSLVRRQVNDNCTACARCSGQCPTGTIDPADGYRSDPAECIVCYDCLIDCAGKGAGFRWQIRGWRPAPPRDYDPARRQLLGVAGATVMGVAMAGVEPIVSRQPAHMLRPPGADTADFGALCIRCAACVRICPTQGLQPSLFEGGVQNVLTPRLVPRLGNCSFACNACGQVCPTGAIPKLGQEEKQHTVIGLASINRDRCLPWAYATPCIVCEEACPVADKAIHLEEARAANAAGEEVLLQRPRVLQELCIGCGICEFKCPMGGAAAIRVYAPTDVWSAGATEG